MKHAVVYVLLILFGVFYVCSSAYSADVTIEENDKLAGLILELEYEDAVIEFNKRIEIPEFLGHAPIDLWATLVRHPGNDPRPTVLMATAYRRELQIRGSFAEYEEGFNILAVDARGTGSSEGVWEALKPAEQTDLAYIIDKWIPEQPWSDGSVCLKGKSYSAISQMLAAGHIERDEAGNPIHLKAIFPVMTFSDAYKDICMQGGNLNQLFISGWYLATNTLTTIPSTLLIGGENGKMDNGGASLDQDILMEAWVNWISSLETWHVSMGWFLDQENTHDGEFWDERSPMAFWPDKHPYDRDRYGHDKTIPSKLPVFLMGGWYDLFTRGTLNTYQYGLKDHDNTDKALVMGPWYHIGDTMGVNNDDIRNRWYNWKVQGKDDPFMVEYPVLLYIMGEERWRAEKDWPLPESRVEYKTYYLTNTRQKTKRGDWFSFLNWKNNYGLTEIFNKSNYKNKENPVLTHDPSFLHGMVSRSINRWTMGILSLGSQESKYVKGKDIDAYMFWEDERSDELDVLTFTTDELKEDIEITGPLALTFWAESSFGEPKAKSNPLVNLEVLLGKQFAKLTGNEFPEEGSTIEQETEEKDIQWVVELNDVFPNGRAKNITSGWLRASHRQRDPNEPEGVTEHGIDPDYTPFDPFYDGADKSPERINEEERYQYTVELWPTANVFKKGHRIRVSISGSDYPHLLPILVPSKNTIVIDADHPARLDFQVVNKNDEDDTWKWIDKDSAFNSADTYLLQHEN